MYAGFVGKMFGLLVKLSPSYWKDVKKKSGII